MHNHLSQQTVRVTGFLLMLAGLTLGAGCEATDKKHDEWIRAAEVDFESSRYDDAIGRMTELIKISNNKEIVARAYYVRGLSHAKSGQRPAAYSDLKQAVKTKDIPDLTWRAFVTLGTLYFEDSRWASAETAYAAAVKRMEPPAEIDEVLFKLGQCYERLGRWTDARSPYERIAREFPKSRFRDDARRRLEIKATHFAIQCGVYNTRASADQLAQQLRSKGLNAYVRNEARGGRRLNVVLVGRYARYADLWSDISRVRSYVPSAVIWP